MKKATIVPLFVFVLLAGGLFYLLTNFQINLFEGEITKFDYFTEKEEIVKHPYSLGDVMDGRASLDGVGWVMALGIVAGIPFLIAMLVRLRIKRRQRRKMAAAIAAQTQVPTHETVS